MARTSSFPLHDRAHGGGLANELRGYRAEGLSYAEIAFRLREAGTVVSPSTVHRWCRELGIAR